jgi:muramidase (phage lysozyme)
MRALYIVAAGAVLLLGWRYGAASVAPAPDAQPVDPSTDPSTDWSAPAWDASAPSIDPPDDSTPQLPSTLDSLWNDTQAMFSAPVNPSDTNRRAFLDMIAVSEGTAGIGDHGYNALFGGGTFASYADHPRQRFQFTNRAGAVLWTSAAGRYQFIVATWDALRVKLQLPDFSPASQDAACLELIRERNALADVDAGRISAAIAKCAPTWASLPGAGYAQPEQKLSTLLAAFQGAGGSLEA